MNKLGLKHTLNPGYLFPGEVELQHVGELFSQGLKKRILKKSI